MPELPEVETTCRGIKPYLLNQTISKVIVRHEQLRWPVETKILQKHLKDKPILEVSRRAKYILIRFPSGTLVIHLGMSGTLRIVDKATPLKKHDHFDCALSNDNVLRFNDPRRFGAILFVPNDESLPQLATLGPEPLGKTFNAQYLHNKAQKHRCNIKTFIMNQRIVVGVGNIYANECLFLAKIHPEQSANTITQVQYHRLFQAIQTILKAAIEKGGTTLKDFRQSDGKPGYFSQALSIYAREDLPCFHCKSKIKSIRIGQRATYFCPTCQKQ